MRFVGALVVLLGPRGRHLLDRRLSGRQVMLLLGVLVNVQNLLASVVYALVGLVVFVLGLWVFRLIMPFDVRKEIEVDQNVSLGIVIGSFIIGLALIVSAAITG
jgi:uncharacterized membrane protein YjfL (UPF0719 family)